MKNVDVEYQVVGSDPKVLDRWLPWVHKFISNAKTWIVGTHHGVQPKYLAHYLAEYTYRFNRRHDPDGLFHRPPDAFAIATPVTAGNAFRISMEVCAHAQWSTLGFRFISLSAWKRFADDREASCELAHTVNYDYDGRPRVERSSQAGERA